MTTCAVLAIICGSNSSPGNDDVDNGTTAERLLQYAGQAEVEGDAARQFALLREAVRLNPDNRRAQWQLGQVEVEGEWLSVEEAQRRAAADPLQEDYERLREEHGDTPEGQLALARWCRSNDLEDESRTHWASVLSIDPNHREALRALKLHWYDGRLLGREEIKEAKQEASGARAAGRHWGVKVAQWERALAKKDAASRDAVLEEIRAIRDVEAIPAFERLTLDQNDPRNQRERTRGDLSRAFVEALGEMPEQAATESLVRHGVLSQFADIRHEAADLLHERPLHDFVPLLLEGLAAPIESTYDTEVDADGSVHFTHRMYREGPTADWSHRARRSIYQPMSMGSVMASVNNAETLTPIAAVDTRSRTVSAAAANRSARRYEDEIAAAEQEIARANSASAALNERIFAVLMRATDEDLGDEPRAWWDWWQDHTEYYRTADRPVLASQDVTREYVTLDIPKECFAKGTQVWTKTGQRAIETLKLGDLVLSQNVETGELAYRPVLARTVRPPSEILNVTCGGETIRATRGHLFWVAGEGWRMAKELPEGAVLHGVPGSARVRNIESSSQEEAYNLVVADFNTYFVGDSGLLVHDNTPRKPTRVMLPGVATK
jgi:hypothetical protein